MQYRKKSDTGTAVVLLIVLPVMLLLEYLGYARLQGCILLLVLDNC